MLMDSIAMIRYSEPVTLNDYCTELWAQTIHDAERSASTPIEKP